MIQVREDRGRNRLGIPAWEFVCVESFKIGTGNLKKAIRRARIRRRELECHGRAADVRVFIGGASLTIDEETAVLGKNREAAERVIDDVISRSW